VRGIPTPPVETAVSSTCVPAARPPLRLYRRWSLSETRPRTVPRPTAHNGVVRSFAGACCRGCLLECRAVVVHPAPVQRMAAGFRGARS